MAHLYRPVCTAAPPDRVMTPPSSSPMLVGRKAVLHSLAAVTVSTVLSRPATAAPSQALEVQYTEEEWAARLPPLSYRVLRKQATERAFTSPLNEEKRVGIFSCMGCGNPLYASSTKFDSGTGWPSFYAALPGRVVESRDTSIPFLPRTEVSCARCGGHLGHVFADGPKPTGLRYCMNGAALTFQPKGA